MHFRSSSSDKRVQVKKHTPKKNWFYKWLCFPYAKPLSSYNNNDFQVVLFMFIQTGDQIQFRTKSVSHDRARLQPTMYMYMISKLCKLEIASVFPPFQHRHINCTKKAEHIFCDYKTTHVRCSISQRSQGLRFSLYSSPKVNKQ